MLCLIAATTFAAPLNKDGKVILVVTIQVTDFQAWKKAFDAGDPVRKKSGIQVLTVCSSDNETKVVVIEEAENRKSAEDFLELLKAKQKSGDMSALDVKIYDKEL